MYTELVVFVMGVSLLLYTLLGGADFGAGIIELFIGNKGNSTVTKAIAPVWEANHMWLIIAVVILFNGFPKAYTILSTNLHIPVLLFLIGIIFRGAAFTFRHYDAYHDKSEKIYSYIFRGSSLFAVFFLGVTISAFFGGTIPNTTNGTFSELYIAPWCNWFSCAVGLFMVAIAGYISAAFILGEVKTVEGYDLIHKFSTRLFILSMVSGLGIFASSYFLDLAFHRTFVAHPLSIISVLVATLLIPLVFNLIKNKKTWKLRFLVGFQITLIMMGWFVIQWPNLVLYSDGSVLTIHQAASPIATMKVLFYSLAFGVLLIFPALYYLFRLFKIK